MPEIERIRTLRKKGLLNLLEGNELTLLLDEQFKQTGSYQIPEEEIVHLPSEEEIIAKEREGKKMYQLKYRSGNIFQNPKDMEWVKREVWAEDATAAAETSCRIMRGEESHNLSGASITDALSCRLNTFEGDQSRKHKPIWVNPYSIAPSQQYDGGPVGFLELVAKNLTGKGVEIVDGEAHLTIFDDQS